MCKYVGARFLSACGHAQAGIEPVSGRINSTPTLKEISYVKKF